LNRTEQYIYLFYNHWLLSCQQRSNKMLCCMSYSFWLCSGAGPVQGSEWPQLGSQRRPECPWPQPQTAVLQHLQTHLEVCVWLSVCVTTCMFIMRQITLHFIVTTLQDRVYSFLYTLNQKAYGTIFNVICITSSWIEPMTSCLWSEHKIVLGSN